MFSVAPRNGYYTIFKIKDSVTVIGENCDAKVMKQVQNLPSISSIYRLNALYYLIAPILNDPFNLFSE